MTKIPFFRVAVSRAVLRLTEADEVPGLDIPLHSDELKQEIDDLFRINNIFIVGRVCRRKLYGGWNNSARIYIDGKLVHTLPRSYGNASDCVDSAVRWLESTRRIPERPPGVSGERWMRDELNIQFTAEVVEVPRQRDLQ